MTSPASITAIIKNSEKEGAVSFPHFCRSPGLILYAIAVGSYGLSLRMSCGRSWDKAKEPMRTVIWNIASQDRLAVIAVAASLSPVRYSNVS